MKFDIAASASSSGVRRAATRATRFVMVGSVSQAMPTSSMVAGAAPVVPTAAAPAGETIWAGLADGTVCGGLATGAAADRGGAAVDLGGAAAEAGGTAAALAAGGTAAELAGGMPAAGGVVAGTTTASPSVKPDASALLATQPVNVTVLFAGSALDCANAGATVMAAIPQSTNVFMATPF
jgi:hypothetical protein